MIKQTIRELNIGSWKSNDDYLNIINHKYIQNIKLQLLKWYRLINW